MDGWGGFPAAGGLFQLRLAEEGRRVSTTNRARSVGLEKGIGSVWNVGFQEDNFLFGLRKSDCTISKQRHSVMRLQGVFS